MRKLSTMTEQAVIRLNHIALTIHYKEFQWRLDRLVRRMAGNRKYRVCEVCILEVIK
jgi:hypothetical protein